MRPFTRALVQTQYIASLLVEQRKFSQVDVENFNYLKGLKLDAVRGIVYFIMEI